MGLINIPTVPEAEKGIEQAEDHLLVLLNQFRAALIADIERILDERSVVVTFPKKPAASPMGTPQ